jgi:hypothetical protein
MRTAFEVVAWVLLIGIDGAALVAAFLVIRWNFRHVLRPMFAEIGHALSVHRSRSSKDGEPE